MVLAKVLLSIRNPLLVVAEPTLLIEFFRGCVADTLAVMAPLRRLLTLALTFKLAVILTNEVLLSDPPKFGTAIDDGVDELVTVNEIGVLEVVKTFLYIFCRSTL